jgi:putative metallohydrolase (TIGR04338 family)
MANDLKWYELPVERWQELGINGKRTWRDSQKQKVYNAEFRLRNRFRHENTKFESIEEIKHYLSNLLKSTWFIRRWGIREEPLVTEIQGNTAYGNKRFNKLSLPKWAWNKIIVLHELSHILHKFGSGTSHGRYFCRTLLELIDHELSPKARRCLKKQFTLMGIRSTPHPAYSEATKIKKKEHGRKLAKKYGVPKSDNSVEWNKMLKLTGISV